VLFELRWLPARCQPTQSLIVNRSECRKLFQCVVPPLAETSLGTFSVIYPHNSDDVPLDALPMTISQSISDTKPTVSNHRPSELGSSRGADPLAPAHTTFKKHKIRDDIQADGW
jgi:hypothetical protein